MSAHRVHIHNMDRCCDLVDENERADSTECLLQLGLQDDKIVFADGSQLQNVRVLVLAIATLLVVTDELARVFVACHEVVADEVDDAVRMRLLLVLEVQSFVHLLDSDGLFVGLVTQDQLLQEQEGSLVVHALSDLHLCLPGMRCVGDLAIITLQILHHKLNLECLLEKGVLMDFFLDS